MLLVEHQTRLSEQETNSYEIYKLIFYHEKSWLSIVTKKTFSVQKKN